MPDRLRVLVVDDDPEFLAYVKEGLAPIDAVTARTPLDALWHLEHDDLRAILCDLCFGDVDGRHLLEVARDCRPELARVLVTGFGNRLDGPNEQVFPAAQAVLHKPCDLSALSALLALLAPSPT